MSSPKPNHEAERRLLDMLAGWSMYTADDDLHSAEEEVIADLYQQVSNMTEDPDGPSVQQIAFFLVEKVVPFILNGVKVG